MCHQKLLLISPLLDLMKEVDDGVGAKGWLNRLTKDIWACLGDSDRNCLKELGRVLSRCRLAYVTLCVQNCNSYLRTSVITVYCLSS